MNEISLMESNVIFKKMHPLGSFYHHVYNLTRAIEK